MEIKRLVEDLGGAAEVSRELGLSRTTPYRWIDQNSMNSKVLEQILAVWNIDLMDYFEVEDLNENKGGGD